MSASLDLVITSVGATTPVGLSAPASCAALRAGVTRIDAVNTHLVDADLIGKDPVIGGRVPMEWFEGGPTTPEWPGFDRFEVPHPPPPETLVADGPSRLGEIAGPAAREAWADPSSRSVKHGLYLGMAESDAETALTDAVAAACSMRPRVTHASKEGRAALFAALRQAAKDLLAGDVDVALVGGVDSLIRRDVLVALDRSGALRSSTRPQGVIPGEAAAFFVLERAAGAGDRALAHLANVVTTEEPTTGTEDPNIAAGLTAALHRVRRRGAPMTSPPLTISDLNGDRYRAIEWVMASMRAFSDLHGDEPLWHPADCIGDTGAASGAISIVWAVTAFGKGYAPSSQILTWGASDGPLRGAALLASASGAEGRS